MKACPKCGCEIDDMSEVCTGCMSSAQFVSGKPQPGIFADMPLPWSYDEKTRNVLAADGAIVCRNGDEVYGNSKIGESIVKVFNAIQNRCPQCSASLVHANLVDIVDTYCEECGWPDEVRQ